MNNKLIGVFLVLMGAVVLPEAATNLKNSVSHPEPTAIAAPDFFAETPKEGYFKLRGAQLNLTEALYVDENGKVGNIYVPARQPGKEDDSEAPIAVLVRVSDAKSRQFIEKMAQVDSKNEAAALNFLIQNRDQMVVKRDIVGTIAEGFDALDDDDKRALEHSEAKLSSDFVILQEGATPSIGGRIFMLLSALGLIGGGIVLFRKKS